MGAALEINDLQGAYLQSGDGEILLDSIRTGITLRDAVAPVSSTLFEVFNNAGSEGVSVGFQDAALLDMTSTTRGLRFPRLTEAQRDAIGSPLEGLVVFNTDDGHINQYNGSGWTIPGAGLTTLQGAYDNDPVAAQIILNGVPDPITIQASVAGTVLRLEDVLNNPILEVTADPDAATVSGGLIVDGAFLNGGAVNSITISDTFTTGGAFIGGALTHSGTITYNNAVSIFATFGELVNYIGTVSPGFAAYTMMQGLPRFTNGANVDLVGVIGINMGPTHERVTSGTSVAVNNIGMSYAAQTKATVSGAVMTKSTQIGMRVGPTFSTVAGSTVNLGTITGVEFSQPAAALFQPAAGVENMTAYRGINFPDMTFGGASAVISVVKSQLNSGTNKRFLDHTGTAASYLGGSLNFPNDFPNGNLTMGASADFSMGYIASNAFYMQVNNPAVTQWRYSAPSTNRLLMECSTAATGEFNFNCQKFSLGLSTGTVGNQVGNFVAGARTTGVAGEWTDFLLTQAANLTVDHAVSVYGWTINAPSMTLGTGTVSTAGALNVGGNVNQGSVNRFGVRILSNPSGGSGINAALWVTAGRSQFDGIVTLPRNTDANRGAAGEAGRIIFNTDDGQINIDDGTNWTLPDGTTT